MNPFKQPYYLLYIPIHSYTFLYIPIHFLFSFFGGVLKFECIVFCFESLTVRFLIHGRHARILARVFGVRSEDRGGGGGWGIQGGEANTALQ